MKHISEILQRFHEDYGIKRFPMKVNYDKARKCFIDIANSMLAWTDKAYDPSKLEDVIKQLISWAYMLDGTSLDFNKGILLKGGTGRGKTFLLKVFAEFLKIDNLSYKSDGKEYPLSFKVINAKNIVMFYQNEGANALQRIITMPCLCIDDIGAEMAESSHYGNKTSVIDWIIDQREERHLITFGTTNFNRLSEQYDDRVISRINSLFNILSVSHNKDYRRL